MLWPSFPLWLIESMARTEREAAADDDAIAGVSPAARSSFSAADYAETLLVVAGWPCRSPVFGIAGTRLGTGQRLEQRIRRLVDSPAPPSRSRLAVAASAVVGAIAFAGWIPVAPEFVDPGTALQGRRAALERRTTEALLQVGMPRPGAEAEAARMVGAALRLMRALPARDWRLEGEVTSALAQVRSTSTLEPLASALEDGNPGVRERSAWALGQLGDRRAVPLLVARLQDPSPQVRETTAWALGQIGDLAAMPALVATLEDDSAGARQAAAWALGRLGDARAVEPLIRRLGDASADARHGALWALGAIGDGRAAASVRALLEDPSHDVRSAATVALEQLARR
jgi:HEAT repeat protein